MNEKDDKETAKSEEPRQEESISRTDDDQRTVNKDKDYGEAMRKRLNQRRRKGLGRK